MFRERYAHIAGWLLAVGIPFILYEYLRLHPRSDLLFAAPAGHFYIVSSVSLLSLSIAIIIGISAGRVRNIKMSFLALAFISLAEVFVVHGLSTPGFILGSTPLPEVAAQFSLMLAIFWLWMSSLPSDHRFVRLLARRQNRLISVWTLTLGGLGVLLLFFPSWTNWIPVDRNPIKWILTAALLLLNLSTIYRYWQSFRFTRFPLQISIVYIVGWISVSQVVMVQGEMWRMSWWIYHFLLLISMVVMIAGVFRQYASKATITAAVRSLFGSDPVERIQAGISPRVRTLIVATEEKDKYTAGHNFRVAMLAFRLAEHMKIPPEQLKVLAQGAIVHDVGKIQIPDHILNKPGKLTAEERVMIEKHPEVGYEICKSMGFMQGELEVVRSHHEKWDGTGYPDGLKGDRIPMLARIAAVADVYDALTSSRSYREAWPHEKAMDWIGEQGGRHFDPVWVAAWQAVCAAGLPEYTYPSWVPEGEESGRTQLFIGFARQNKGLK